MDVLNKPKKNRIIKYLIYAIGFFCAFKIASYLSLAAYFSPYFDSNIVGLLIITIVGYSLVGFFGFIIGVIINDSSLKSLKYIHITLLGGMVLFLIYIIPFKTTFINVAVDNAYEHILKEMGLDKNHNEITHSNKDIEEIFKAYENREISKLSYFKSKIDDIKKIKDDEFAQLIVNVRVLNNKAVNILYNRILEDKRISINEYRQIVKLIISEEVK